MKLKFINRWLATIDTLLKQNTEKTTGIPKCIEFTTQEAKAVLDEIANLKENSEWGNRPLPLFKSNSTPPKILVVNNNQDELERNQLILDWQGGKISVTYVGVPLTVEPGRSVSYKVRKSTMNNDEAEKMGQRPIKLVD